MQVRAAEEAKKLWEDMYNYVSAKEAESGENKYSRNKGKEHKNEQFEIIQKANPADANLGEKDGSAKSRKWFEDNGYDGVIYTADGEELGEIMALYPNQIKSAEAVTRDGEGTVRCVGVVAGVVFFLYFCKKYYFYRGKKKKSTAGC